MRILIRADASPRIGSGHVMRTLALAQALRSCGAQTMFACRPLPPSLRALAETSGIYAELPNWNEPSGPAELPWGENHRVQDIADCTAAFADWKADWVVVDHYASDPRWERAATAFAGRVAAIDDILRAHDCDLLVDGNLHGDRAYSDLPARTRQLVGPRYALLRPEFAQAHDAALARDGPVRRLLVFLGGMDRGNATGLVLEALGRIEPAQRPSQVDVVIGPDHPLAEQVAATCHAAGFTCHKGSSEMARLCLEADLAVGAGGSSTWERCSVGLPALSLRLADNQRAIIHYGSRAGVLYEPGAGPMTPEKLAMHLRALIDNPGLRHLISRNALAMVDGRGATRVAQAILA